ncbi:MAG: hypothetical protein KDD50_15395, partial [Bdellovibrionales bacterium]|nr:hypothetical protein [Bdellovibrionales bacterium]
MFLLRRLRYQVLQNKKGQGLPASIIAAGLVLILLISFYSLNKMQSNFKLKVDVTNLVQNLRFNIYSAIRNGEASELTRLHADNATPFDCINTGGLSNLCCGWDQITQTYYTGGTTCTKLDGPVTIVNNKGEILSQKRSPLATIASGFDLNGEYCTNFDMVNGNDACPFRFDVTVSSMCKVGKNCTSPQIKYHVKFLYSPDPTNLRLNAAGLLGADKDPNTVSDFDFTILNDAITDASSSEATIKSFDHDYCTGAEVYPSADCNAPDIDTDAVEFWAPPSGVNKFLVEVWG